MTKEKLLEALLSLRSRGEIKNWGKKLDRSPELTLLMSELLDEHGHVHSSLPGKKAIRLILDREAKAQVVQNPKHIDEGFVCLHCAKVIPPGGQQIRDHCPFCLRSLHLDRIPGDRAANCGGLMHPQSFTYQQDQVWIHYQCESCQYLWRVRAHPDDQIPFSLSVADIDK